MMQTADIRADPEIGGDPLGPSVPANDENQNEDGNFWRSKINEVQFPLVLVLAASIVLLIAVLTWETGMASRGYALAVPSLSLVIALCGLLLTVFREDLYATHGRHLNHFLFMWNFTGACFLTFSSPFTTTGNGYFAAWACVATSGMAMGLTADAFKNRIRGLGSLMGLCASAAIVVIALVQYVDPDVAEYMRGEVIYAMVVSVFTVILCLGLMYFQKQHDGVIDQKEAILKFGFLAVFAILWFVLAFLVTFSGPFVTTGNGYFASWCGAVCACSAAFDAMKESGITIQKTKATVLSATIS